MGGPTRCIRRGDPPLFQKERGTIMGIEDIKNLADEVVETRARHDAAIEGERTARTELLLQVLRVIEPAISAICSRVDIGAKRGGGASDREYADWKGLLLHVDAVKRTTLYLSEFGSFKEVAYSITNMSDRTSVLEISPRDVVNSHRDTIALNAIAKALDAQADGRRDQRASEAEIAADRINAVVTLLKAIH